MTTRPAPCPVPARFGDRRRRSLPRPPGDDRVGRPGRRRVAVDQAAGRRARERRPEAVVVRRSRCRARARARRSERPSRGRAAGRTCPWRPSRSSTTRSRGGPRCRAPASAGSRSSRRAGAAGSDRAPGRMGDGGVEDLDALRGVARDERDRPRGHCCPGITAATRDDERRRPAAVGVAERREQPDQRVAGVGRVDSRERQREASAGGREERVRVVERRPRRGRLAGGADHVLRRGGREADRVEVAACSGSSAASRRPRPSSRSGRATARRCWRCSRSRPSSRSCRRPPRATPRPPAPALRPVSRCASRASLTFPLIDSTRCPATPILGAHPPDGR